MEEYFLAMDRASEGGGNILVWDICNEPNVPWQEDWLRQMLRFAIEKFDNNKVTVGFNPGIDGVKILDPKAMAFGPLCDIWTVHFYAPLITPQNKNETENFRRRLPAVKDEYRALLRRCLSEFDKAGIEKPVMSNEACWGSLDDALRVEIVDASLDTFVELGIGFTPHALQESLAPDLHRPEYGHVGWPGFMAFVMMDGSLRPGHDVFNKYAEIAVKGNAALGIVAALTNSAPAELVKDGLLLQLDGSSVVEQGGGEVAGWKDLSGSSRVLTVPAGCKGSSVDAASLNGQPVLEFKRAEKTRFQLSAHQADVFNVGTEGMTFFVVCRPDHFQGWQGLIQKGNFRSSGHEGYTIAAIAGGDGRFVTRAATKDGDKAGVQAIVRNPKSGFHLYSTIIGPDGVEGYLNGEEAVPFGPAVKYQGIIEPQNSLFIGGFDGAIAEILIYKRALSLDEINQVNAYLSDKYALTTLSINKLD
jgi:hypothetical protein